MAWKDRLVKGSFRGVGFWIDSYEWSGGRRASIVEFPQRETIYVEDLGRSAARHTINVLLIGEDYPEQRDKLFRQLGSRSSGWPYRPGSILTHPYLGRVEVLPLSWRVTESRREGGICRVSIDYVESSGPPTPVKATDANAAADGAAEELEEASADAAGEIDTDGPGLVESFGDALRELGQTLNSLDVFSQVGDIANEIASDVTDLTVNASRLATAPADAIATARSALSNINAAFRNFEGAFAAYDGLFGYESPKDGPGTSPTGSGARGTSNTSQRMNANADRFQAMVRNMAIAGATRAAVRIDFDTLEDATAARDRVLATLDAQLEETDARTIDALEAIRVVLANQVPRDAANLPNLRTVELPEDLPALVLSYRLYRTPDRDEEIAERNRARYPGFLPPIVPLEVLSS